jgi:multidrug efflux pump subunit AcrA (membrane-fusion protein)
MPTDLQPAVPAAEPEDAAAAQRDRRRMVVNTKPFFYDAEGKRVELGADSLGGTPAQVDPQALEALDAAEPAAAPVPQEGQPDLPPDARRIFADDSRQIFVDPRALERVGARAAGAPRNGASPSTPSAAAAPSSQPAPAPLAPLSAAALSALAAESPVPPPPSLAAAVASAPSLSPSPAPSPAPAAPSVAVSPTPPAAAVEEMPAPAPAFAGYGEDEDELARADAANVEMRSEELDEILSAMPGGLLRWGTSAVFLTVAVLIAVSWWVAYPDVVTGRITLTTTAPPVRLVARAGGEVARVFVHDGQAVKAGDPLVLMKSPAELPDVQALSAALDRMDAALDGGGAVPGLDFGRPLSLGSLQAPYSALQQAYNDYAMSRDQTFFTRRLEAARTQVAELGAMRDRLVAQQSLVAEQLALSARARDRTRELVQRGLAAPMDLDKAEEDHLQKQYAVETGRSALANNEIQLASQRAALLDLEQGRSTEGQRGVVALRNAEHSLRAAIAAWEQDNLLRAPISGTVSYFRELRENQYLAPAEPTLAVVAPGAGLVGRVTLTGMGAGKVRPGQRVIIRLESFPYREYGTVQGRVERVSQLGYQADSRNPDLTTYQVDVSLPGGLVTTYGRRLALTQEMRGDVDVVTDDLRLLQRILNKIRSGTGAN